MNEPRKRYAHARHHRSSRCLLLRHDMPPPDFATPNNASRRETGISSRHAVIDSCLLESSCLSICRASPRVLVSMSCLLHILPPSVLHRRCYAAERCYFAHTLPTTFSAHRAAARLFPLAPTRASRYAPRFSRAFDRVEQRHVVACC